MEWYLLVIGQLALLLVGSLGACLWYIRNLRASNRALFEALPSESTGPVSDTPPVDQESQVDLQESTETAAAAQAETLDSPPATTEIAARLGEGSEGLKKLLQQFTLESRDMHSRIEVLEQQLADLLSAARHPVAEDQAATLAVGDGTESVDSDVAMG